ncbi:MAG: hypothetical protein MI861_13385 [Pirellulales bacterium]|nr:hypothetical protein [Pirellulales bacterium]
MSDPIIQQTVQRVAEQAGQQTGPQSLRQVNPEDQQKFEETLNRQTSEGDGAHQEQVALDEIQPPGSETSTSGATAPASGIEHGIVKEASRLENSYHQIENKMREQASQTKSISPMDLLQTQIDLVKMETQLQFELKVADKVGSDVQTLANRQN